MQYIIEEQEFLKRLKDQFSSGVSEGNRVTIQRITALICVALNDGKWTWEGILGYDEERLLEALKRITPLPRDAEKEPKP